jgi:2-dehydropantoate 2-reductase
MKVSVLGAGAIGSMIGGLLRHHAADIDVTLIGRGEHGRVLIERQAVLLDGPWGSLDVPLRASGDMADVAGSDFVFVTVKSQATEEAARAAQPYWSGATIVSIQNGINDHLLAPYVDPQRLVMGVTATNFAVTEPGRVSLQLGGATILGPPAGRPMTSSVATAVDLLQRIRCPDLQFLSHANILGMRYNKLAVNALGYASCLSESNFISEALTYRPWRAAVGQPIVAECRGVFDRAGIRLQKIPGVPSLPKLERIMRLMNWPLLGAVVQASSRRRFDRQPIVFSLLQDLRRGKATEVDHINGEIVRLAGTLGLSAPVNAEVVRAVHELEARGPGAFFAREEVLRRFQSLPAPRP